MGLFSQKQPKFKGVEPPKIRVEKVAVAAPKPRPVAAAAAVKPSSKKSGGGGASSLRASKSQSPFPSSSADERKGGAGVKRKHGGALLLASEKAPRRSPAASSDQHRVEFGSDSSGGEEGDDDWEARLSHKRRRRVANGAGDAGGGGGGGGGGASGGARGVLDSERKVRRRKWPLVRAAAEKEVDGEGAGKDVAKDQRHPAAAKYDDDLRGMIHAADLASLKSKGCVTVLGASPDEVGVELQYPGSPVRERYNLVFGKDMIDAVKEIIRVVRHVSDAFFPDDVVGELLDTRTGIIRRLEKASNRNVQDLAGFKRALDDYNALVSRLAFSEGDGSAIPRHLDDTQRSGVSAVTPQLVDFILGQVYDRTVAPKVELLARYENGTDYVYGELLHPFISDILLGPAASGHRRSDSPLAASATAAQDELDAVRDWPHLTSESVFVDLGSGVGNVALHAALLLGCEALGCEVMEHACDLADRQLVEFERRCKLWGIRPGKVRLERGDFRTNDGVMDALKRADVVLVNNQAFTAQLNDDLVRMFLDLKTGCRIISLRSFVKASSHNINDVGSTILDVEHRSYPEGYVSWTAAGGTYCVSTRK